MERALVYGLAVAGRSTAAALVRRGVEVVVVDDEVTAERRHAAAELDVEITGPDDLDRLVAWADIVCPSPGVPESHDVITAALAAGRPLVTEIELAYRWEQERPGGPRPMLAVTGTDGKTTTTLLAVDMLRAAGLRTVDAGNTSTPLVDAIEMDLDAIVVECTSFRLTWAPTFRAEAATWLNFAPDHLDWHRSMGTYEAAKATVFENQRAGDVAIGFTGDDVVMKRLAAAPGRHVTFGLDDGDYRLVGDVLTGPAGPIVERSAMGRDLPHDVTNTLAAAALGLETGLFDADAVAAAVATFVGPPHRLEPLGVHRGSTWYNDSKATTPHAAAAAIRSFDRIVLIAGGYDKRVDLAPMAAEPQRLAAVVAIGDTAPVITELFAPSVPVHVAGRLDAAVELAAELTEPGDVVLLSPGCASFDHFTGFEARGDEFRRLFAELTADSGDTDTATATETDTAATTDAPTGDRP